MLNSYTQISVVIDFLAIDICDMLAIDIYKVQSQDIEKEVQKKKRLENKAQRGKHVMTMSFLPQKFSTWKINFCCGVKFAGLS